jgi:hypothetical protein
MDRNGCDFAAENPPLKVQIVKSYKGPLWARSPLLLEMLTSHASCAGGCWLPLVKPRDDLTQMGRGTAC